MASLNPLISFTEPVTRQDLFDMWGSAAFTGVTVDDFADGFLPIVVGSTFSDAPSSPTPGQLFWHQTENLMFCYHDEVADTGVSLWLAIGPDRFDTAMFTKTAVAAGEAVELVGPGRTVQAIVPDEESRTELPVLCGFNQSGIDHGPLLLAGQTPEPLSNASGETFWMGETSPTDSWIAVGVDGLVWAGSSPGSHPSEGLSQWSNNRPLILSSVPGLPAGVLDGNDISDPFGHIVAGSAVWNVLEAGTTRTEPWWITKVAFMPRASRGGYFST